MELTGGRGADRVIDMGRRATLEQSTSSVAYEGTLALVGGLGGYDGSVSSWSLIEKSITAQGVLAGSRTVGDHGQGLAATTR
jgi:NADPH:quinone reductase-like Zn-dependent oxidoreductase